MAATNEVAAIVADQGRFAVAGRVAEFGLHQPQEAESKGGRGEPF